MDFAQEKMLELYEKLYLDLNRRKSDTGSMQNLSFFSIMEGKNYKMNENIRLLLIGRAVNGWGVISADNGRVFAETALEQYKCRHFDSWLKSVNGTLVSNYVDKNGIEKLYHPGPFFEYAKSVYESLNGKFCDPVWLEHIAWTNLYKISPSEGGNPYGELKDIQKSTCVEILRNDIELLKPTHMLCMTGYNEWFDGFEEIFQDVKYYGKNILRGKDRNNVYVEAVGRYQDTKVVVTCRPEFRPRDVFVEAVCKAFQ